MIPYFAYRYIQNRRKKAAMANISDTFGDFPVHGVVEDRVWFWLKKPIITL